MGRGIVFCFFFGSENGIIKAEILEKTGMQ